MTTAAARLWWIAVDIGGTFTDVVAIETSTGERFDGKVLTNTKDPGAGFLDALELLRVRRSVELSQAQVVVHATTLAINTVIERSGARVALLTTYGFRDTLETGNEGRYDLYDLQMEVNPPLIPRHRRIGIRERISAKGTVLLPLEPDSVVAAVNALDDVSSIAVAYLNSYANPRHELETAETVRNLRPDVYVTVSSEIAPIIREYERFTAAALNAYVGPRVSQYVGTLRQTLLGAGFCGELRIMKSDGGMFSPESASSYPLRMLESGPAAGVLSAAYTALQTHAQLAVAFDMGGTTAKACLITGGEPAITDLLYVDRYDRSVNESGFPVRMPSVDLIEIGAGGGTIAWLDGLGIMQVGPQSAGADPGPACYGNGGRLPTVTDADLLLGYLLPEHFASGAIRLDVESASAAITNEILRPTGTSDLTAAAWGINDIVNENMARAVRSHCLEHGVDPAATTIIATGGAGPVHAAALMNKLGAKGVLCPPSAGVASAFGLLLAPTSVDKSMTEVVPLSDLSDDDLQSRLAKLEDDVLGNEAVRGGAVSAWVSVRLQGQGYDVKVQVPDERTVASIHEAFEREYRARFRRPPWAIDREVVEWMVRVTWGDRVREVGASLHLRSEAISGHGRVFFGPGEGWCDASIIDRSQLRVDEWARGPMLVVEPGTTIVVPPRLSAKIDEHSNVLIEKNDIRSTP